MYKFMLILVYFGTALKVESKNEFAFSRLALADKKNSMAYDSFLKDQPCCIGPT